MKLPPPPPPTRPPRRDDEKAAILDAYRDRHRLIDLFTKLEGQKPSDPGRQSGEVRWRSHGSLSVDLRKGLFFDHEAQVGGDVIEAVKHFIGCDFRGALDYLRDDLGWPTDSAPPEISEERRRELEATALAHQAEDNASESESLFRAQSIWSAGRHISGTPGQVYLEQTRAIGPQRWDTSFVRWHDSGRMLLFAATTDEGEFTGIQRIAVTRDGLKDLRWRSGTKPTAKLSLGPVGRGVVRLPGKIAGETRLLVAEGPETGLSAWAATGYEAWIALGGRLIKPPPGRRAVYLRDDDKRNPKTERKRRQTFREWRTEGLDLIDAKPFARRRADKSDFNNLLMEQGVAAVHDRVNLFALDQAPIASPYVPLADARAELDKRAHEIVEEFTTTEGVPVYAIKLTVGGGKSDAFLRNIYKRLKSMRAAGDRRVFVFMVPFHDLGEDLAARWREIAGDELKPAIWRGRESRKPGATDKEDRMCGRIEDVRLAQKLRVKAGEEICPTCPLKDACAYLGQRQQEGDIWFMAHPALFSRIPKAIGAKNVAGIVIDETPWQSGIIGRVDIAVSAFDALPLPQGDGPLGSGRCADIRSRLAQAAQTIATGLKEGEERHLTRAALEAVGFDAQTGLDGAKMEAMREVTDGPWRLRKKNATVGPMVMVWRTIAHLFENDLDAAGRLVVGLNDDNALVLSVSGRMEINSDWQKPTVLIDASLEPDLLKEFWSGLTIAGEYEIDAPHMRVHQVEGRAFSKTMLAPLQGAPTTQAGKDLARYKARSRRSLRAFILKTARQNGGRTLAIGNLDVIAALDLPAHIETAHFNALCGLDDYGDVRSLIVIGRTQPSPYAIEDMAEALTGRAVTRLPDGEWYPRRDATRLKRTPQGIVPIVGETEGHPDQTVELIRRRICEGEIGQAIGRGRGINRTAETPLDVYVLSDVALDIPVDTFLDPEDVIAPSPLDLMAGEGGIIFADGTAAAKAYPSLWKNADAAKKALQRSGTLPKKDSFLRNVPNLLCLTFQREGAGQRPQQAWIDPAMASDPRVILEATFGPLARFELIEQTAQEETQTVPAVVNGDAADNFAAASDRPAVDAANPPPPAETAYTIALSEDAHRPLAELKEEAVGPNATPEIERAFLDASIASLARRMFKLYELKKAEVQAAANDDDDQDDGELVPPEWFDRIRQQMADRGLLLRELAEGAGHSAADFCNAQRGIRRMTRRKAKAFEAYLDRVPLRQERLL